MVTRIALSGTLPTELNLRRKSLVSLIKELHVCAWYFKKKSTNSDSFEVVELTLRLVVMVYF